MDSELLRVFALLHITTSISVTEVMSGMCHKQEIAGTLVRKIPAPGKVCRQNNVIRCRAGPKDVGKGIPLGCVAQIEMNLRSCIYGNHCRITSVHDLIEKDECLVPELKFF